MTRCELNNDELRDAIAKHDEMVALAGGPPAFTLHTRRMADALRELLEYREAPDSLFRVLELSFAYEQASQIIDGSTAPIFFDDEPNGVESIWRNIDDCDELGGADVPDAVRYLDGRGLLERHPEHSNWVLVIDEDASLAVSLTEKGKQAVSLEVVPATPEEKAAEAAAMKFGAPYLDIVFAPADEAAR